MRNSFLSFLTEIDSRSNLLSISKSSQGEDDCHKKSWLIKKKNPRFVKIMLEKLLVPFVINFSDYVNYIINKWKVRRPSVIVILVGYGDRKRPQDYIDIFCKCVSGS